MNKLLILGGTGFVGQALCEQLSAWPQPPVLRVPTRRRSRGKALAVLPKVELIEANVHDASQLSHLLEGCDAVVNLVAILHGSEAAFEEVHVGLPRRLVAACAATGVRRLVHVSALGVAADAPSRYLRSKARGEAVLQEAASAGLLQLSLLRPSVIFGANDRFLNLFASLQALAPVVPLAGADARFQPVWVGDVAAAIGALLRQPLREAAAATVHEAAGPDVVTLADLVRLAGKASGNARPVLPLPAPVAHLQALLMELAPGEPLMSRDNLASMQVPNVATGQFPGLADLGIQPAALAAVAPMYLSGGRNQPLLDAMRARRY